jgi:hypothetical protein
MARRLAQHPHRQLRERTAGVAQECDDGRAAVLERDRKARRAPAGLGCRLDPQRAWREKRPRIHELNVTPLPARSIRAARARVRAGQRPSSTSPLGTELK